MKRLALKPLMALPIVLTLILTSTAIPALAGQTASDLATTSAQSDPEANLPYLFAVYTITWVVFFVYLFYLTQRQNSLKREVEDLKQALAEQERQVKRP